MKQHIHLSLIVVSLLSLLTSGCQPVMRLFTGISSELTYAMNNQERLQYYHPYLEANNVSIYALQNPLEFCKNINYFGSQISIVYFEDSEQKQYYSVNCFDDIKGTFEDLNKGDLSYLKPVLEEDFLSIKNYITDTSERVYKLENQKQAKRWNIYLISGTFMGEKLKKRTVTITKIKDLNHLYILDLSVDSTNKTITEKDFQTITCSELTKSKVDYLR